MTSIPTCHTSLRGDEPEYWTEVLVLEGGVNTLEPVN